MNSNNGALLYLQQVKTRRPEAYGQLLQLVRACVDKTLGGMELIAQVKSLFKTDVDLIRGFAQFLPDNERGLLENHVKRVDSTDIVAPHADPRMMKNKRAPDSSFVNPPSKKRKQNLQNKPNRKRPRYDDDDTESEDNDIDLVQMFRDGNLPLLERQAKFFNLCEQYLPSENYRQLKILIQKVIKKTQTWKTIMPGAQILFGEKTVLYQGFNELFGRPVSIQWLSGKKKGIEYHRFSHGKRVKSLDKVHDSYYKLPKDCIQPICSRQNNLVVSVVNTDYICKSSMTQEQEGNDSPFTMKADSQYEHNLLVLEDRHFEIDIMIGRAISLISAMKYAREMGNGVKLDQTHERLLLQLYGPAGFEMIDLIQSHHTHVIPIILPRLEAKWMEWRSVRSEMTNHWEDVAKEENSRFRTWTNGKMISDYQDALSNLDFLWAEMVHADVDPNKKQTNEFMSQINRKETKRKNSLKFPLVPEDHLRLMYKMCAAFAQVEESASLEDVEFVWRKILFPLFQIKMEEPKVEPSPEAEVKPLLPVPDLVELEDKIEEKPPEAIEKAPVVIQEPAPIPSEQLEPPKLEPTFSWKVSLEEILEHMDQQQNFDLPSALEGNVSLRMDDFEVNEFDKDSTIAFADQGLHNLLRLIQVVSSHLKDCTKCLEAIDTDKFLEICGKFSTKEITLSEFETSLAEKFANVKIPWKLILTQVLVASMVNQAFHWIEENTVFKKISTLMLFMQQKRESLDFGSWMQAYKEHALSCLSRRHLLCAVEMNKEKCTMEFIRIPVRISVVN